MSEAANQDPDETLVDLRCSVILSRGDEFLLIERPRLGNWVLPGGRPRRGESLQSCARREALEETGLQVNPTRCAFVAEVIEPETRERIVELIFLADVSDVHRDQAVIGEQDDRPSWVNVSQLRNLRLKPPIAGYLASLAGTPRRTTPPSAPYLGNLWRWHEDDQAQYRGRA